MQCFSVSQVWSSSCLSNNLSSCPKSWEDTRENYMQGKIKYPLQELKIDAKVVELLSFV